MPKKTSIIVNSKCKSQTDSERTAALTRQLARWINAAERRKTHSKR